MLSSYTAPTASIEVRSDDSTKTMHMKFEPARIVVQDNRTTGTMSSVIEGNTKSNTENASAISKVAEVLDQNLRLQERRCASIMDRITQQSGLSQSRVEYLLHKKRIYDVSFYTLFLLFLFYMIFLYFDSAGLAHAMSMQEYKIKTINTILIFITLFAIYYFFGQIFNGPDYNLITKIINASP
jgi:hypothetical protein